VEAGLVSQNSAARLVLQIHDELLLESPQEEIPALQQLVVHEMQEAMELSVPLEVSVQTGATWAECEK